MLLNAGSFLLMTPSTERLIQQLHPRIQAKSHDVNRMIPYFRDVGGFDDIEVLMQSRCSIGIMYSGFRLECPIRRKF